MRILYFSYAYPNAAQPTLATFNRSLLEALSRRHSVRVVSPISFVNACRSRFAGRSAFDRSYSAIPGVVADYVPFFYPPKLFRHRFDEFLWQSVRTRLRQVLREFRPDVILSYWAHPDGAVAVRAGREFGIPVVTMVGGSDVLQLARAGKRREAILNALHQADAVVAVSRNIARTLEQDGLPSRKLSLVRRGIDRGLFHPGERDEARRQLGLPMRRFTIVNVGRLAAVKGQTHLIAACSGLHREGRTFGCYILGDGPLRSRLHREIQYAGLSHCVELRGARPQSELVQWYRAADVVVLPSLSEGIPNVLLEAMAVGTPFIATDVGDIPEIADERFDDLIPAANPTVLADALRNRIACPSSTITAPRQFQPGSWDDSARALCSVFAEVCSGDWNSEAYSTVEMEWTVSAPPRDDVAGETRAEAAGACPALMGESPAPAAGHPVPYLLERNWP